MIDSSRARNLLIPVVVVLVLGVYGYTHARSTPVDNSGWVTYCFGRFLIDLPPQARIGESYRLRGNEIERIRVARESLGSLVEAREHELRSQMHDTEGSMFLDRLGHGGGSESIVAWKSPYSSALMNQETYLVSTDGSVVYRYSGDVSPVRGDVANSNRESFARNVRSRSKHEIPTESGFCIDGGYIAGREYMSEQFRVGITLPEHPGMHLTFRSSTGAAETGLLDRAGGFLRTEVLGAVAGFGTLRKRRRAIGPIEGEEFLVAASDQGQRVYAFKWEAQGRDNSLGEPNMGLELGVMERDSDDADTPPPPAFESDDQALKLWDAILESIRLRPGAV